MADEDSHEQTPLLSSTDDDGHEQAQLQHDAETLNSHSLPTIGEMQSNIHHVISDIPHGNTSGSGTKGSSHRIQIVLPKLFSMINALVEDPDTDDSVVTEDVTEFLAAFGREVVYCLLRVVETYQEEGDRDAGRKALMDRRAQVAEKAAAAVTKMFVGKDLMLTYCHVLCQPYYALGEEKNTAEGAIEIAIRVHATNFLSDVEVQKCVQALWNGLVLQAENERGQVHFVEYSGTRRSRHHLWEWFDVKRLNVPRYQNNMRIALFVVFLIMYTIVVNVRTREPTPVEWVIYVFVTGYIFEEFRLIVEGGTAFFLGSLWHWLNIISYSMFIVSFAFRLMALSLKNDEDQSRFNYYNDLAYDIKALLAVFLWVKSLSLLDGYKYFGTMTMVLQKMLKDGIMFFWLLAWVYAGFWQSFYALLDERKKNFYEPTVLLIRGFLQDPDWEMAEGFDHNYGGWLFAMYLFFTSIILLNLLVALFNSSYTNITDSAEKEYLALFTFKVFSHLKSPDQFPFPAPFNLIEVLGIIPLALCTTRETYARINNAILGTLFYFPLLAIAYKERGRYMRIRDTTDDEIRGGRRVYRNLTLDESDQDLEDLFMLATQEMDGLLDSSPLGDTNDNDTNAKTIIVTSSANGADEEANIGSSNGHRANGLGHLGNDILKPAKIASESFEEFRARRQAERDAKAAASAKAAKREQAHATLSAAGPSSLRQPQMAQVSNELVQSLLTSLARMEQKQKDMEQLLQAHVAKESQKQPKRQAATREQQEESEEPQGEEEDQVAPREDE